MDPLELGPEGAQHAQDMAVENHRSMLRLRLGALALVVGVGVVLIRANAAIHALWLLPAIPLLLSADFKLGGLAEANRALAEKHYTGKFEMASADEILRGGYRSEYYGLLAAALVAVAIRG